MDSQAFLDRVGAYQRDGWRLAIINTTSILPAEGLEGGAFDVSWSFAKDSRLEHLRERVLPGEEVPTGFSQWRGAPDIDRAGGLRSPRPAGAGSENNASR